MTELDSIIVRTVNLKDISDIIELQKESFPLMAKDGVIWSEHHLEIHIKIFPEGQLYAEIEVVSGENEDLVLSFQSKNGFKFIKNPAKLYERRSLTVN